MLRTSASRRRMALPVLPQLASSDAADWSSTRGCIPHTVCARRQYACALAVPSTRTRTCTRARTKGAYFAAEMRSFPPPPRPHPRPNPDPECEAQDTTLGRTTLLDWKSRGRIRGGRGGMSSKMNRPRRAMVALHHTERARRGRRSGSRIENA